MGLLEIWALGNSVKDRLKQRYKRVLSVGEGKQCSGNKNKLNSKSDIFYFTGYTKKYEK